eukprot:TRINITY_DN89113_c0_g1_i1.p2 TRINITY_DN89113_c0_g1~~TRINITY_DN89113_c0_g1_i1.p2  ORF type:complete len:235 (-),score=40.92 TRINITY_DN89113_c0_g1_i1:107-811(-)
MGTVVREARAALQAAGESSGVAVTQGDATWQRPVIGAGARRRSGSAGARLQPLPLSPGSQARPGGNEHAVALAAAVPRPPPGRPPSRGPPRASTLVPGRPSSGPPSLDLHRAAVDAASYQSTMLFSPAASCEDREMQDAESLLRELEAFDALLSQHATALDEIAVSECSLLEQFEVSRSEAKRLLHHVHTMEEAFSPAVRFRSVAVEDDDAADLEAEKARMRMAMGFADPLDNA